MFLRSPDISGTGDGFFRRSPLAEFGVGARSFAIKTLCGRGGGRGARESRSKTGHTETDIAVNIQNETTTTLVCYIPGNKDTLWYRVVRPDYTKSHEHRLQVFSPHFYHSVLLLNEYL